MASGTIPDTTTVFGNIGSAQWNFRVDQMNLASQNIENKGIQRIHIV